MSEESEAYGAVCQEGASLAAPGPQPPHRRSLPAAVAAKAVSVSRNILMFGVLLAIDRLQQDWDGETPPEMPYDEPPEGKKKYETLESFLNRSKGFAPVISISRDAAVAGVGLLEALVRVLLVLPGGIQFQESPLLCLKGWLEAGLPVGVPRAACNSNDVNLVLQMVAIGCSRRKAARYGGLDARVLELLSKSDPSLPAILDRWGMLVAQAYVDTLRHIGGLVTSIHWEKKTTLSKDLFLAEFRNLEFATGIDVDYCGISFLRAYRV